MDRADMLEALITGNLDGASRRVHASMSDASELPKADDHPPTDVMLQRMGVRFVEGQASRRSFRRAVLPAGWKITPSDHYMYSHLRDVMGRRRAQIGYSAQDGWASIVVLGRFEPSFIQDDWDDHAAPVVPCVYDSGNTGTRADNKKVLWRGKPIPDRLPTGFGPTVLNEAAAIAAAKLDEVAPDWRDRLAYWGEKDVHHAGAARISGRRGLYTIVRALPKRIVLEPYCRIAVAECGGLDQIKVRRARVTKALELVWPASESVADMRVVYRLETRCFNGGCDRDGGTHATRRAASDDEAVEKLVATMDLLTSHYDEVRWSVVADGGRVVRSGVERKRTVPRDLFTGRIMVDPYTGRPYGRDMRDD